MFTHDTICFHGKRNSQYDQANARRVVVKKGEIHNLNVFLYWNHWNSMVLVGCLSSGYCFNVCPKSENIMVICEPPKHVIEQMSVQERFFDLLVVIRSLEESTVSLSH